VKKTIYEDIKKIPVTGGGQQKPFHNASEMTHLERDHYIPLV
jgi:hypothetical protein